MRLLIAIVVVLSAVPASAQVIPARANQFKRALIGNARVVWGLNAPIAVLSAQVAQESGWRPDAKSPYAGGLAQFTPATAADISRKYPELADNAPFEPSWALRALARYDYDLYQLEPNALNDCHRWGMTLSSYNGGRGNVLRQKAAARAAGADPRLWFGGVENYRVRSVPNHVENRTYPRRILLQLQPAYLLWGIGVQCEGVS